MKIARLVAAITFAGLVAFPANGLQAQVEDQDRNQVQQERQGEGDLAVVYTMVVEPEHLSAFEEALAEHARWRLEQGDPWNWDVYQVASGEDLGRYYARAPSLTWAEMDDYDADFGPRAGDHFTTNVGPYVRSLSSMVTRLHEDAMTMPDDLAGMEILAVTVFEVEPGEMDAFWRAADEVHDTFGRDGSRSNYTFHSSVVGAAVPQVHLVTFHDGWADLETVEPAVAQRLVDEGEVETTRGLGPHEHLSTRFPARDNMILRYRMDLSVRR
jgi:hypothetical protein